MSNDFLFVIKSICFDEDYCFGDNMCMMINFVNLVWGVQCWENLCNIFCMINNCFNVLVYWDNFKVDCYVVELDIIFVEMGMVGQDIVQVLLLIEVFKINIVDYYMGECIEGIVGNNFFFYVCDYDFSVVLLEYMKQQFVFSVFDYFGELYGNLFKCFVVFFVYCQYFSKLLVICFSVVSSKIYECMENLYLVLGVEYL